MLGEYVIIVGMYLYVVSFCTDMNYAHDNVCCIFCLFCLFLNIS